MRKALVVGVNHYDNEKIDDLNGSIYDAEQIEQLLSWNYSDPPYSQRNFVCDKLVSSEVRITRASLRKKIKELFEDNDIELALFYFSGHGYQNSLGGHLVTQDAASYEEGVSLNDIMTYANQSTIHEIVIVLDCCHSGHLGIDPLSLNKISRVRSNICLITSSDSNELSFEKFGEGIFTSLVRKSLEGQNGDLLGRVTTNDVCDYTSLMLDTYDQTPQKRDTMSKAVVLRRSKPKIKIKTLKKITSYFKKEDSLLKLDPLFAPIGGDGSTTKEIVFKDLELLEDVKLIKPVNSRNIYYAASDYDSCILTGDGIHYWTLIKSNKLD